MLWLPVIPETAVQELLFLPHSGRNESHEYLSIQRRGIIRGTASETYRGSGECREERTAKAEIQNGQDQS